MCGQTGAASAGHTDRRIQPGRPPPTAPASPPRRYGAVLPAAPASNQTPSPLPDQLQLVFFKSDQPVVHNVRIAPPMLIPHRTVSDRCNATTSPRIEHFHTIPDLKFRFRQIRRQLLAHQSSPLSLTSVTT